MKIELTQAVTDCRWTANVRMLPRLTTSTRTELIQRRRRQTGQLRCRHRRMVSNVVTVDDWTTSLRILVSTVCQQPAAAHSAADRPRCVTANNVNLRSRICNIFGYSQVWTACCRGRWREVRFHCRQCFTWPPGRRPSAEVYMRKPTAINLTISRNQQYNICFAIWSAEMYIIIIITQL